MPVSTISAESLVGVLADGTPYYAPIGEVIVDGSLVTCHLCGRALRSVTAHLEAVRRHRPQRLDARWLPAVRRLGFSDVPGYLHERHIVRHWSVNAIAAEIGFTHHTVQAALRRHGVTRVAHAAKRHVASQRAAHVAGRLGFDSIAGYVAARRPAGWTWAAMAAECAQPSSWLRRQARPASPHQPCE